MKKIQNKVVITVLVLSLVMTCFVYSSFAQEEYLILSEKTGWEEVDTYHDIISYYRTLADDFPQVQMKEMGLTDSGYPLHLVIYDPGMTFEPDSWRADGKIIVLNNNGIHPGECPGVDAARMFLRDVLLGKTEIPDDVILVILPVYNISGYLNRVSSHLGKGGPLEYGTRRNVKNLDLNRDFMKSDTRNAQSFQEIFNWLKPHLFIDTHEDTFQEIQHIPTILCTSSNKLGGQLGDYLIEEMQPVIFEKMEEKGFPPIPYIAPFAGWGASLDEGLMQYNDNARYSTGFTTLFNTLGFMPEYNRLKLYPGRVNAYHALFETYMEILEEDGDRLVRMTEEDRESMKTKDSFGINYTKLNEEKYKMFTLLRYEQGEKTSAVTGQAITYYDHTKPFSTEIRWYYHYDPVMYIERPQAYIIPQGWWYVVEILERNGVAVEKLEEDSTFEVTVYHIEDFKSRLYEGHNLHSKVKVGKSTEQFTFKKGDYLVPMNQESNRFIIELLEPQAENSLFAWNWFDNILSGPGGDTIQPRGLTSQQFEDQAAEYLKENPDLKEELEALKKKDEAFAKDKNAQLYWVYEQSPWYCETANRYPIYRIER